MGSITKRTPEIQLKETIKLVLKISTDKTKTATAIATPKP